MPSRTRRRGRQTAEAMTHVPEHLAHAAREDAGPEARAKDDEHRARKKDDEKVKAKEREDDELPPPLD